MIALDDLQTFVPNLSYATTNVGDMTLSVRGVGSLVSVNDGESGVSLHVNEVPLPPGQPPIELYDVERIEVLRGPEGTLYGRNATGGRSRSQPRWLHEQPGGGATAWRR